MRYEDPNVRLDSFIISNTAAHTMKMLWGMDSPRWKHGILSRKRTRTAT